jgi:hypothetical protein
VGVVSHRLLGRLALPWPVRLLLVVCAALCAVVILGGAARGDGLGSITSGGVEVRASETVDSVDLRPALSLSLGRDLADVQPGGRIVYSPTLTNTGAQLRITGTVRAKDAGQAAAEIAAFHDYIDYYSKSQAEWVALVARRPRVRGTRRPCCRRWRAGCRCR